MGHEQNRIRIEQNNFKIFFKAMKSYIWEGLLFNLVIIAFLEF